MCERVFQNLDILQLIRVTGTSIIKNSEQYEQSYNIGPEGYLPAIKYASSPENNNRQLDILQWGYNTRFQQVIACARAEEIHLKKTFKPLVNSRRCCVIVEGYYEWNSRREPFVFLHKKKELSEDGVPSHFLIGAVYTPDDSLIILTRDAAGECNGIHDRMPLLLEHDEVDMWIDCKKYKYDEILKTKILSEEKELFKSMFFYQIAPYVNDIKKKNSHVLISFEEYKKEIKSDKPVSAFSTPKKSKAIIRCKTEAEGTLWTGEKLAGKESKSTVWTEKIKESKGKEGLIKIENNVFKTLTINRRENNDPIKVQIKNDFVQTTPRKNLKKELKRVESDIEPVDTIEGSKRKMTPTLKSKEEKEKLAIVLKSPNKNLDDVQLDIEKGYEIKKVVVFVQKTEEDIEDVERIGTPNKRTEVMANRGFAVKLEEGGSKKRKDYEEKDTNFMTELKKMKKTATLNPFLFKKEET